MAGEIKVIRVKDGDVQQARQTRDILALITASLLSGVEEINDAVLSRHLDMAIDVFNGAGKRLKKENPVDAALRVKMPDAQPAAAAAGAPQ